MKHYLYQVVFIHSYTGEKSLGIFLDEGVAQECAAQVKELMDKADFFLQGPVVKKLQVEPPYLAEVIRFIEQSKAKIAK